MATVKIGSVNLPEKQAEKLYSEGKYIVTYKKVYQLHYSAAQKRVYGSAIYTHTGNPGLTAKGRFHAMSAQAVNDLVGFDLVNTQ